MKNEEIINSIINSFHEKKNSHAFLLETNNLESCYKDLIHMIKVLNCKNCTIDDCNVCHTIDVGTNPDIITVKPVKKEIGVEPINNIIKVFSTQPLISQYSMYIIYEADLLSISAANTILKFLEEPEEGIVGFFITSRLSSMLPTITSRCELINIRYGNNSVLDLLNISEEEYMVYYNIAKHLISVLNYKTNYERLYKSNDITKYEREEIIKQLCEAMKKMHSNVGEYYDWSDYNKERFNKLFDEAKNQELFNEDEIEILNKVYSLFDKYLVSNEVVLVHNDIHFDNIFINNDKIKIIDFERSMYAPKDFDLHILYYMIRQPWKHASEDCEKHTKVEDYANIMIYIEKYYPEIIHTPNLYKRLAIYDVIYELSHFIQFPKYRDELREAIFNAAKIVLEN